MSDLRVIKKYENRRLYDTGESRYVNLEEVARLVREGEDVQVVDAKTGEDLTRSVLTQIIVESSRASQDGPPLEFLRDLVKSTDRAQRDFLQWYLGAASENYRKFRESFAPKAWPSIEAQREAWAKVFDPFGAMRSVMRTTRPSSSEADDEDAAPDEDAGEAAVPEASAADDLADLKKRLEELEEKLSKS